MSNRLLRIVFSGFLAMAICSIAPVRLTTPAMADSDHDGGDHDGGENEGGDDNGGGHSNDSNSGDDDQEHTVPDFSSGFSGTPALKGKKLKYRSLSSIVRQFKKSRKGRFLDATITKRKGVIYYKVTYIGARGKVEHIYYKALRSTQKDRRKTMNFNRN